jgi:hypothetical protein
MNNTYSLLINILHEQSTLPPDIADWTKKPELNSVVDFLSTQKPTEYSSVDEIAQSLNLCPIKTEKIVSFLAKITAYLLRQGKMNQENIDENSVNQEQLKMGINVEKEHIECPFISRKIALDHLAEIPDYYTRLERMERDAGIEH